MSNLNKIPSIDLIRERVSDLNISCTSMVVTLFGDVVSQHGNRIWLGSLIEALGPLGFNERLVRTAAYRLVQNDWLQVEKVGRRSFYALTDFARGHHERADRRIYATGHREWDGNWTLVTPVDVPEEHREALRKNLRWQGFNPLVSGMYAHPSSDRTSLDESLLELGISDRVIVFTARTEDESTGAGLKALVQQRWNLDELRGLYRKFLDFFKPWATVVGKGTVSEQEQFLLRLVLIHDYRRILLRDADLPAAMLPPDWEGFAAQELMHRIYCGLVAPSTRYIMENLENAYNGLPAPQNEFYQRLGGLPEMSFDRGEARAQ